MKYKENVLDRMEQSFILFKNNLLNLIIPVAAFNIIIYLILKITWLSLFKFLDFDNILNIENLTIVGIIGIIFFIYLILQIGIIIGIYKTINDIDNEIELNLIENYKYGFLNILNSFKTYFFIFMYSYFIPCIIFIIGGIYFIYEEYYGNLEFNDFFIFGIIFYIVFSIIFVLYRYYRSIFSIISAVVKNDYSKNNFNYSLNLTKGKWLRIFGNFFVVGIIVGLITSLIGNAFSYGINQEVLNTMENNNFQNIDFYSIIELFGIGKFNLSTIIGDLILRIVFTFSFIFISIFTYIFFKRLEEEQENNNLN